MPNNNTCGHSRLKVEIIEYKRKEQEGINTKQETIPGKNFRMMRDWIRCPIK